MRTTVIRSTPTREVANGNPRIFSRGNNSHQYHLGSGDCFLGVLYAAGVRHAGSWIHPRQECRQYPDEEPHGFLYVLDRLLGGRVCPDVWCRQLLLGQKLLLSPKYSRGDQRRSYPCFLVFPAGFRRGSRYHRCWRYGRENKIPNLPYLQSGDQCCYLSRCGALGMG